MEDHKHTEQLHVVSTRSNNTWITTIKSFCLSCGDKVHEAIIKEL